MSIVYDYYLHVLALADLGHGLGWYPPFELLDIAPDSPLSFVIPVKKTGSVFPYYWVYTATDLGVAGINKSLGCYQMVWKKNLLILEHNIADISFRRRKMRHFPYLGNLYHPDFNHLLTELEIISDEAFDVWYKEAKQIVIGPEFPDSKEFLKNATRYTG